MAIPDATLQEVPTGWDVNDKVGPYVRNTLLTESSSTRAEALAAIYKIMRPGEPPTEESSEKLFYDLFFARFEAIPVYVWGVNLDNLSLDSSLISKDITNSL